ncbi:hypothetical protein CXG46_04975 [Nocardioides alpinus]|uniref:Uncharacterized protein n=1 Tax=Nocardioides alpinus TaxID=748909 RepID=A0ABX4R1F7_9ACTN|nr:hypothetical protein CXG46_04975 [Nocardioides alpinus]
MATISGEASTRQEASAGFAPHHRASRGTAHASRSRPTRAITRWATTSSQGSAVRPAARSPPMSGTGPYGAGVAIQRGSTPSTIGPGIERGPTRLHGP